MRTFGRKGPVLAVAAILAIGLSACASDRGAHAPAHASAAPMVSHSDMKGMDGAKDERMAMMHESCPCMADAAGMTDEMRAKMQAMMKERMQACMKRMKSGEHMPGAAKDTN